MLTNKGLIEYAKSMVGMPYWFGANGQIGSKQLHDSLKRMYPSYYTANDFKKQYGKRVHDCSGLLKAYLWGGTKTKTPKYDGKTDYNSAGFYSVSKEKGTIDSMPKIDGIAVYKTSRKGSPSRIHHIGYYCTDGYVYEAKGHAYGVVKTKFKASEWHYWSKIPFIDYSGKDESKPATVKVDKASMFSKSIAGNYKTTSDLHLRTGASTSKKSIKVMKNKTKVTCYGYYSNNGSTKWYLVQLADGTTGFCSSKYLRKV